MNNHVSSSSSRQGVALVLVLGFLSLLLILAVAFASTMRVERMATRNYSDVVAARNLVDMAVARAMADFDSRVGTDIFPGGPVVVSDGSEPVDDVLDLSMEYEGPLGYIPQLHHPAAKAAADSVKWTEFERKGSGTNRNLKARIAYMVVDSSGFLDANYVADDSAPRNFGTESFEIAADVASLSGLEITDTTDLNGSRDFRVRFETLPEFFELGQKDNIFTSTNFPENFTTYSYFPAGYWEGGSTPVKAPLVMTSTYDRASVSTQLSRPEFGLDNPAEVALLMEDYLDADFNNHPSLSVDSVSSESLPMVNEIYVTNAISVSATTNALGQFQWTNSITMSVELWYPFIHPDNDQDYDVAFFFLADAPFAPSFNPGAAVDTVPLSDSWVGGSRFQVATLTKEIVESNETRPDMPRNYRVGAVVRNAGDGTTQDRAVTQNPERWTPGLARPPATPGDTTEGEVCWQVDDPRLNWDISNASVTTPQWVFDPDGAETLSNMNSQVTFSTNVNPYADGDWTMYASSRADMRIKSIGEFGYLLHDINRPWETIRFWGPDPAGTAKVLDGFTINPSIKGYVNANTANRTALAAAFVNAPIRFGPDDVTPEGAVSKTDALNLADAIISGRPYTNRSEIGATLLDGDFPGVTRTNALLREAVVRNTIDLLHTRQNLVTVIALGQVVSEAPDDSIQVVAEQRAVAKVWRDPFPDTQGKHPTFIRFFKWLD